MSAPRRLVFASYTITTRALIVIILSLVVVGSIGTLLTIPRALASPIVSDNFNDNSLETAKWDPNNLFSGFTNTNVPLAETAQRLEIGPLLQNVSGSSYRGIRTVNSYNFSGAYSYVELVQAPASNTAADAMFTIGNDVDNFYRLYVEAGTLYGQKKVAGTKTTLFSISYDSTNHRFLRIRHDSTTGNVTLDTAPGSGGVPGTWVQRYTETWNSSISTAAIIFEIKGGTFQVEANAPGKVIFDNFEVASNSAPAPTVTAISPTSGTTSGGTSVTITGTGFSTGATVSLGGTAATNVTVVSSTSITATTPAHAAGTVNVVVSNTDSQSGTLTNGYTFSAPETLIVSDDFNDNSLETAKWDPNNLFSGFTNTNVPLAETAQRLEIGPLLQNVSGSSYRGIRTVNSYNFSGAYSYVELVQAPASNTAADAMFTIGNDVDNFYRLYVEAGTLYGQRKVAGTKTTLFSISYDSTNHRFLRIRHDSTTGNVTLDTAPGSGGVPGTWVQRYTETWNSSISTTAIIFEVKGGTWQVEANAPGKVIFDNFRVAVPSSGSTQTPPSSYNANTTRTSFTEPALTGALDLTTSAHQAGYSFTDPTFGTTITRITDANTNTSSAGNNFLPPDTAEVSSWNLDSTKFYVQDIGGNYYPFSWNGTSAGRLGSSSLSSGGIALAGLLTGGSALPSWSGKDAQIMWGTLDFKLRKLDFTTVNSSSTTVPYSEVLDYAAVYNAITGGTLTGSVCSLGVSGVDAPNDFVATAIKGGQDTWTWALWWNAATNAYKILDTSTTPLRWWNSSTSSWSNITGTTGGWHMHNVKIDRSGRYVLITAFSEDNTGTGNGKLVSWDTTNNTLSFTTPAYDGGHRSGGYGYMINQYANGTDATQWLLRPASDLTTTPTLLVSPYLSDATSNPQYAAMNPDFDEHSSWHTARNGTLYPVFSSTSRDVPIDSSHPWRPYDNEIVAIKTSTPGTIWRFAHHQSTRMSGGNRAVGYFDYSFGQVSPDGRYFLFSSNWGLTLHYPTGTDPLPGDPNCAPNCYRIDTFVLTLP